MKIDSNKIELFKNLSQYDFGDEFYDFHNEFNCVKIFFEYYTLSFFFKKTKDESIVVLKFFNVSIVKMDLAWDLNSDSLTIDSIYRGRFEMNRILYEFSDDGKSYFYLEFNDEKKLEFFSNSLIIEKIVNSLL